ncbi:unnamed protein product [Zymoseptoria tritici ST99CH_3D1]|uniref:Thioesterase domain-containing protein n=1 Tax=Zymoseptoria tritici (strain ST99CH_3D7) TaxID=1276538 RepID=A0A1X7RVP7_ZYMT9|nr:unnamed protein product [Zymoseptoria tritici ST99CH_3D7]SMR55901.1 unnamed protein product [Zymoseptoria tritici ST99CH_3D1]
MSLGDSEADRVLVLIQAAPRSALRRNPPLLLSHDGSGTIFNYYLLDPLERDVFGFQDPRAACGNGWEGGIHQMARLYYDCMKTAVKPGPVLLGGWSFGGLLSLEISSLIIADPTTGFAVAGIVLIDTVCPTSSVTPPRLSDTKPGTPPQVLATHDSRKLAASSMRRAEELGRSWQFPAWNTTTGNGLMTSGPIPTVLLCAKDEPRSVTAAQSQLLGWEQYQQYLTMSAIQISGTHFSIFHLEHAQALSEQMKIACTRFTEGICSL